MRLIPIPRVIGLLVALWAAPTLAADQVPFGDVVSEKVTNYHRHMPTLATSGKLLDGAVDELQAHGFVTVIDLRGADEGTEEEAKSVSEAGLRYLNLPVSKDWPSDDVINQFSAVMDDSTRQPALMHCRSGNRAAVVWAAYRQRQGASFEQVLLEAQTIGLKPEREPQLREQFGR